MKTVTFNNALLIPEILKLIDEGHTVTIPLRGYSMRPFLEDGRDKALLSQAAKPKVGDPVLAIVGGNTYVLHRVIRIDSDKLTLLGDGNLLPEHCQMSDVVASVVGFYRKGQKELDRIDGKKWKAYSCVWMSLRPMRRWLLAFYRRIWIPLFNTI